MLDLWKHQREAVVRARTQKHLALFHEVGTGKSATMIQILREDYTGHKRLRSTLIFCPLSVCPQWKREFAKFSKINQDDILVLNGTGKSRVQQFSKRIQSGKPWIAITNYEAVQIKAFYELLCNNQPEILICDESQRLKSASSGRSKKIYPLALYADRRFIMTGTPVLNSLMDLFGQYKILNKDIFGPNFFVFQRKYFYDKNAGMPSHVHFPNWVPRPEAAHEIARIISSTSVQAKKSECLDLPPLLRVPIRVELSPAQRKAYEDMRDEFVAEFKGAVAISEFAMTKTLRMQQILSGYILPEGEDKPDKAVWFDDLPRLKALEELLESLDGAKVIIWTTFRPTYGQIAKLLDKMKLSYAFLTGDQSASEKQKSIDNFCHFDTQVLIANPAAGGVGVNLVQAKYAIYYSRGYSLEHYLQSEARNFRGGSEMHDKITHYHIMSDGTLDEIIAEALIKKQNIGDAVLFYARNPFTHTKTK